MLPVAVPRSPADDNAIRCVFPVLWINDVMFSHNAGQIQIPAWSVGRRELFIVTRQVAPLNCARGLKSAIDERLVVNRNF